MKKYIVYPVFALLGGGIAFFLRLMQNRTGFEADTGLPIPGNLWGILLAAFLILLAIILFLLVRALPREDEGFPETFSAAFSTHNAAILSVLVAGVFLLFLAGAGEIACGMGLLPWPSDRLTLPLGALSLVSAAIIFYAIPACRRSGAREASPAAAKEINGNLLLIPVCYFVLRLVVTYREDSINPSLTAYYVELLALVFSTLAFYRLSSFAFQIGQTRRFALYAMPSLVLCLTALADSRPLYSKLFFAGDALVLLSFLLLRLDAMAGKKGH